MQLSRRVAAVLLSVLFLALISGVMLAQGRSDLTGTWSGYIGRSEASPSAVKVEFKQGASGKLSGSVTGPQLSPGDITAGSYDAATGALKFTVAVRNHDGDKGGMVTFDGRVANDTASGKMLLDGQTGVFKLMKGNFTVSVSQAAAKLSANDGAAIARRGFVEVSGWITRAAELVPAERYSYRPVATVRTFGQQVGHVVDGARYYCSRGAGKNVEWTDGTEKGVTTKAALVQALKQAFADCTKTYDAAQQLAPLMENVGHSSLHYGNMITYLRMMGLTPPSS